mmetsp:Transcript_56512/g.165249  ORF Transcript_56512/g.165249 Transcript_56512/m.165249 type:complete len:217 (-) Transcript_56512:27-677(-)
MQDLGSNHRAWQQRLGKERRPTGYAVIFQKDEASRAGTSCSSKQSAPGCLRGSASEPSLTPARGSSAAGGRHGPRSAPQSGGPASRTLQSRTPSVARGPNGSRRGGAAGPRQSGWLPRPPSSRPETGSSSFRRSGELVLINNGKRQSIPPTPSLRSAVTGTSMDSALWDEVAQVVQQEVAKIVGPLQAQLKTEADARQRVEAALARSGAPPGEAAH